MPRPQPGPGPALPALAAGDVAAFKAMVTGRLYTAQAFELWCEPANYEAVAFPLYGERRFPFPLSRILAWQHKRRVAGDCLARRGVPDADTVRVTTRPGPEAGPRSPWRASSSA